MKENYIKAFFTGVFALISSMLGVLTIPVILMVACNVLDYATGLMASTYRSQDINSYKSIRGIMKKVCMWLLGSGGSSDRSAAFVCISDCRYNIAIYISGSLHCSNLDYL